VLSSLPRQPAAQLTRRAPRGELPHLVDVAGGAAGSRRQARPALYLSALYGVRERGALRAQTARRPGRPPSARAPRTRLPAARRCTWTEGRTARPRSSSPTRHGGPGQTRYCCCALHESGRPLQVARLCAGLGGPAQLCMHMDCLPAWRSCGGTARRPRRGGGMRGAGPGSRRRALAAPGGPPAPGRVPAASALKVAVAVRCRVG